MPKIIFHDSDGVDKTVVLGSDPVLIGRATECQVQTQDAMVSRRHARIFWDGNYWIEDLGSSNGVYVGNDKVQKAPFRIGDTVTCGSLVLRLMPDTTPRSTGAMSPQSTGQHAPMRTGMTPAVGNASFASTMPPPAAPPPMASPRIVDSGSRSGDVQIGPNAVLRGAVANPGAVTGPQNDIVEELRQERQRREHAEAAVLTAADRVKSAEARAAEFETLAKDASLIKRKLDQAQADLRRLRGGAPVEDTRDDGELARLRARVVELEADLASANLRSSSSSAGDGGEASRLKRQVEQLQSELRRAKSGQSDPPPVVMQTAPARPAVDPETADAAIALGDSLAELRSSLRAANDEAGLLTAPAESVAVVSDALRGAADQLEAARGHLRALGKLLGVS